jgi:hypothetical protein
MKTPENNYDALVLALKLAITAPDDDKSKEVIAMAESIASQMNAEDVERAKQEAGKELEGETNGFL